MKVLFILLFVAAAIFVAWRNLSAPRKAQVVAMASRAAGQVRDVARAVQERIQRRRYAYRNLFLTERGELNPAGTIVLAHLTKFCYAFATTAANEGSRDEIMRREGRRQGWIEIMSKLSLDPVDALNVSQQEELVLG